MFIFGDKMLSEIFSIPVHMSDIIENISSITSFMDIFSIYASSKFSISCHSLQNNISWLLQGLL